MLNLKIPFFFKHGYLASILLFTFPFAAKADDAALHMQITNLQRQVETLQHEKRELEKRYSGSLEDERVRLRQEASHRQTADFKILLSHLREQLARYDLYLIFDGSDGTTLTVASIPPEEVALLKQADVFSKKAEKFKVLLEEKQAAMTTAQTYYNSASSENKSVFAESFAQAQKERDGAELALQTAEEALVAINQLLQIKHKKKSGEASSTAP